MKKVIAILMVMFIGMINMNAQQATTAKTGTFILVSGNCGEDGCTYTFKDNAGTNKYASVIPENSVQFNNIETGREVKQEFLNKKYSLKYSIKKVFHEESNATSEELVITEMAIIKVDVFKNASCKIYDEKNELISITESQIMYKVNNKGEKYSETKTQNTNEYCEGARCYKVIINKDGFITLYRIPNTTNVAIVGKIDGNKIYYCRKESEFNPASAFYTYTGNKQQAALMIVAYDWFR